MRKSCDPRSVRRLSCKDRFQIFRSPLRHARQHAPHPARAFPARRALPATLVFVEIAETREGLMMSVVLSITIRQPSKTRFPPRPEESKSIRIVSVFPWAAPGMDEPPGMTASRLSQPPRTPPA